MTEATVTHTGPTTSDLGGAATRAYDTAPTGKYLSPEQLARLKVLPVWHPTKPDAATVLDISKSLAWRMAKSGELPTLRLGVKRVVVPVNALLAMLGERSA